MSFLLQERGGYLGKVWEYVPTNCAFQFYSNFWEILRKSWIKSCRQLPSTCWRCWSGNEWARARQLQRQALSPKATLTACLPRATTSTRRHQPLRLAFLHSNSTATQFHAPTHIEDSRKRKRLSHPLWKHFHSRETPFISETHCSFPENPSAMWRWDATKWVCINYGASLVRLLPCTSVPHKFNLVWLISFLCAISIAHNFLEVTNTVAYRFYISHIHLPYPHCCVVFAGAGMRSYRGRERERSKRREAERICMWDLNLFN